MTQTEKKTAGTSTILIVAGSTDLGQADVPDRILVVPWGRVTGANGSFVVDDESAAAVLAAFRAGGNDLPIDYEHQTLGGEYTSPDGRAPAAGWIKSLEAVPGEGIFASVQWTAPGRALLAAKEYRYLSPVALVDRATARILALHSAALTNKPAIPAMTPIVNKAPAADTPCGVNCGAAVSAATPSCDAGVSPAIPPVIEIPASAFEPLRRLLELDGDVPPDHVLVCASQRLEALALQVRSEEAAALVDAAVEAGKCIESQRSWALALAMRDPQAFTAWRDAAPVVVQTGKLVAPPPAPGRSQAQTVINSARTEYRNHQDLHALTSEEAFVNQALRDADLNP